jgi:hypothetical protein
LKFFITVVLILLNINSFGQKQSRIKNDDVTDVLKVTFLNPGIGYEKRIGKFQTLAGQLFMNTSTSFSNTAFVRNELTLYFDPALSLQYRYYYNYKRRSDNDKRTDMNSMNYLAASYEVFFSKANLTELYSPEIDRRPIQNIGIVWGIQRNYKKRFSLDLNLGLGYLSAKATTYNFSLNSTTSITTGQVSFLGQLNLGFWLNKTK